MVVVKYDNSMSSILRQWKGRGIVSLCLLLLTAVVAEAKLTVSTLNPILTDLVEEIGGEYVEILEVMPPGSDVHTFQPRAKEVILIQKSTLIFAMGKGIETYLPGLRDSLLEGQEIIPVGRSVPSMKVDADPLYVCCPAHARGAIDPHWWHSVKNIERAVKVIGKALEKADPEHKSYYKERVSVARAKYRSLHNWVKSEVSKIPKKQRVLVTAHVAFAYFCREYGFEAKYLQGLSKESEISAKHLAETIQELKGRKINAIFPEQLANPKMLSQIAKEIGAKIGKPLYADDTPGSYEKLIRHNVNSIVSALQ